MTRAAAKPRGESNRERRRAQKAASHRRRIIGLVATGVAVVVIAVVLGLHFVNHQSGSTTTVAPVVGEVAPNASFTTLSGSNVEVASLRPHPTLLWFVTTWCSSCQAGTQSVAQNIAALRRDGVRVDEVELYKDLGQSGPSMSQFARILAGPEATNPDWSFGTSSLQMTRTYDPSGYLDIYYLLDSHGRVTYVNGSPGSTMPQLLAAARKLA